MYKNQTKQPEIADFEILHNFNSIYFILCKICMVTFTLNRRDPVGDSAYLMPRNA